MQKTAITIEPDKIYTKSEYAKAYNISRATLNKRIESKQVKSLRIRGGVLVIAA
jgi:DNA invertase Pin-like site-specific DNA recombinase